MRNNAEDDLESQQNELHFYEIPTLRHLRNGRQTNLNISQSTNDEGDERERDCSTDQNKVYAQRIWNSMPVFRVCLQLNEVPLPGPRCHISRFHEVTDTFNGTRLTVMMLPLRVP